jgi:hypothetical protein
MVLPEDKMSPSANRKDDRSNQDAKHREVIAHETGKR